MCVADKAVQAGLPYGMAPKTTEQADKVFGGISVKMSNVTPIKPVVEESELFHFVAHGSCERGKFCGPMGRRG